LAVVVAVAAAEVRPANLATGTGKAGRAAAHTLATQADQIVQGVFGSTQAVLVYVDAWATGEGIGCLHQVISSCLADAFAA